MQRNKASRAEIGSTLEAFGDSRPALPSDQVTSHSRSLCDELFNIDLASQSALNPPIGIQRQLELSTLPPRMLVRTSMLRSSLRTPAIRAPALAVNSIQSRNAHAISNPTLSNIETRWESMPPQEQADLWMALRDRMKGNWHELTLAEKKAGTRKAREA